MIQPDLEGSKVWVHNIAECIKTHFGVTDRILHLEKTSEITHFTMVKQRSLFNRCEHIRRNKTQEATRAPSRTFSTNQGKFCEQFRSTISGYSMPFPHPCLQNSQEQRGIKPCFLYYAERRNSDHILCANFTLFCRNIGK